MTKLVIFIPNQESDALRALAEQEYRDPRAQAALIIRQELERRGLLAAATDRPPQPADAQVQPAPQGVQDAR
jgi:hypothetical protein